MMGYVRARGAIGLGLILSWALAGRGVVAARPAPAVRFLYERAASAADCPDKEIVLDAIRARLGFDPFREPPEIVIRASVSRANDALSATITSSEGRGKDSERRLVSRYADCSELASAMELALSIAIDPLSISREAPPPGHAPPPAAVVMVAPPPAPALTIPPPVAVEPPSPPKFLVASRGATGSVKALLSPSVGLLVGFGLASEQWSVSLEGRADLPSSRDVGGGTVKLSALAATIAPCLHHHWFAGCALVSGIALRGSGQNLDSASRVTTSGFALGARAAAEVPSARTWAVRVHLDVTSPLTRTTLKVGGDPFWTSPAVAVALGLAGVVKFR